VRPGSHRVEFHAGSHDVTAHEYAPGMTQPHHMSKPTEAGLARFNALLDELSSERDVVKASMFGMPGIKRRGGKAFCGLYGDDMIFKLQARIMPAP
jgi:hypothetical protein